MRSDAGARLLIVDDEAPHVQALCDTLEQEGFVTRGYTSAPEAVAALREQSFDLLLTDLMMPQIDGITLLRACQDIDRDLACIVMTGHATVPTAVATLKAGAFDYVLKPFKVSEVLPAISRALAMRRLQRENIQLRESVSIYELARAISQGLDRDEVTARTLAAAAGQSEVAAVYLLHPTTDGHFELAGSAGPRAISFEGGQRVAPQVLQTWLAQVRGELERAGDGTQVRAPFSHPFDRRIGVALPLCAGDTLLGILGFTSALAPRRINPGQLKALDVLARTAAGALATAASLNDANKAITALEIRLQQQATDLQAANQDLEAFAYSVSHDLREPLRAIEGYCEIFRTEFGAAIPEAGIPVFGRIVSASQRMNRLINDLLHYSRFGRHPLECKSVNLHQLALQALQPLRQSAGERPVEAEVAPLPECFGDPVLLEQVLVQLLGNAFKFTAAATPARIQIGSLRQGDAVAYFVRDNGVGFDMRYAGRLFGVFQRFHPQDAFAGNGIGLAIVHRIITRHGGRIWADSRPNEGTTVFFSLPTRAGAR